MSDPTKQLRFEFLPEKYPPAPGDPDHDGEVGLRHEGEDPPGEVARVRPPLQPRQHVPALAALPGPPQLVHRVLTLEPANCHKLFHTESPYKPPQRSSLFILNTRIIINEVQSYC